MLELEPIASRLPHYQLGLSAWVTESAGSIGSECLFFIVVRVSQSTACCALVSTLLLNAQDRGIPALANRVCFVRNCSRPTVHPMHLQGDAFDHPLCNSPLILPRSYERNMTCISYA